MIRSDIKEFLYTIPNNVTLVAATKYGDANDIRELYNAGVSNFGENRVNDFLAKYGALNNLNIHWHFIGHLQRNKAKQVVGLIECLHSLDSLKLAKEIDKYRTAPLDCFVEVSINLEENKNGVPYYEVDDFINECLENYPYVHIIGLMMMAKANSSEESLRDQFNMLRITRDEVSQKLGICIPYLSMGMSDDYEIAIEEGATHIRLGRILFDNK